MSLLIVLVVATLFISAVCSLMEATLYSTRMATIEAAKAEGRFPKASERFLDMKRNISAPTAAILILNTIANTAGATFAGVQAAAVLGVGLMPLFSVLLTLGILFLSEILPKTVGATRWRTLWPVMATPLWFTLKALQPLVAITQRVSRFMTRRAPAPVTTEDEIIAMIRMGAETGQLSSLEYKLLTNVFRFDEVRCRQIMVPRRDVVTLAPDWGAEECMEVVKRHRHTRYPLSHGSLDAVVGLIHVKDLVTHDPATPLDLTAVAREMRRVPESLSLTDLLRLMRGENTHMVLVLDEFGTTVGVVTLENVLEQLVGAMQDEFDTEEPDIIEESPGCYVVRGLLPLSTLEGRLERRLDAPAEVDTLSGLVVHILGRLPETGDVADLGDGLMAEVLRAQSHRASRVRLSVAEPPDTEVQVD